MACVIIKYDETIHIIDAFSAILARRSFLDILLHEAAKIPPTTAYIPPLIILTYRLHDFASPHDATTDIYLFPLAWPSSHGKGHRQTHAICSAAKASVGTPPIDSVTSCRRRRRDFFDT